MEYFVENHIMCCMYYYQVNTVLYTICTPARARFSKLAASSRPRGRWEGGGVADLYPKLGHTQQYARSEYHTQLAKTSFDEIFDLTAGRSVFVF